jgi:hypothetical protein
MAIIGLLFIWFIGGFIGKAIGEKRDREVAGFVIGFLGGPIGWLIILGLSPGPAATCPRCMKQITIGAKVCPYCRRDIYDLSKGSLS